MSLKKLPTRQLGRNGPNVSAIGFGAMGIGSSSYGKADEEEAMKVLTHAADRGMSFWDCADIYGNSEEILGGWFQKTGRRSEIFLATKFGAREFTDDGTMLNHVSSKPPYIKKAIQRSLTRLQTDYIDLYYQHRVDPEVPIEVVLETLRSFVESGKIKWVGLSECSAHTLKRAKAVKGVGQKIIAAQLEFSPFSLQIEKNGVLDVAKEIGVSLVAYSPLGRGLVTGRYRSAADFEPGDLRAFLPRFNEENFPKNIALVDKLQAIANKYGATTSQVALAWILAEHFESVPIPGNRDVKRLEENASAADLKLSDEDVKAIRKLCEEAEVVGDRYPPHWMLPEDCIELSEWKNE